MTRTLEAAPAAPAATAKAGLIQRKCECAGSGCACPETEGVGALVQRHATPASHAPAAVAPATSAGIRAASQGGGQGLPAPTRSMMEARFGQRDFSAVRVHSDARADGLSRQLGAEAFTVGRDIFFAAGRYDPESPSGQRLLAHELTHVVQQGGGAAALQPKLELGAPDTGAEAEADRVAAAVAGGGAAPPIHALGAGAVQRACPPSCPTVVPEQIGGIRRLRLPPSVPLKVYGLKARSGEDLQGLVALYRAKARHRGLQSTHTGRITPSTDALWAKWAATRGPAGEAIRNSGARDKCSPDHIVELNVGGADDGNNLRLLSRGRNQTAGSQLGNDVRALYRAYELAYEATDILEFSEVEPEGGAAADAQCLDLDRVGWLDSAGRFAGVDGAGALAAPAGTRQLDALVAGTTVFINYQPQGDVIPNSRHAVAGLEMQRVETEERIHADVSPVTRSSTGAAIRQRRLPLKPGNPTAFMLRRHGSPARLAFVDAPPNVKLVFPFLSEASLTPRMQDGAWTAAGEFTPTLPLLRHTRVSLEIRQGSLHGGVTVPPEALRRALPVPGLTVDPVSLAIHIADGAFSATGGFGFRYGALASGAMTATFSESAGFDATGHIDLHVPGLDTARGEAWIRDGRFGARLTVGKNAIRFPGVQSANVVVTVGDGVLAGTGTIVLAIPGLHDASLRFTANSQGQYGITGVAAGHIPGLRDPRLVIAYANGALAGAGTAGFAVPGFEGGTVALRYADGRFSGAATIDYQRGKLRGRVTAALSPTHRLSGRGDLSYEIAPGLSAIVVLELRENGTAAVSGELRLPDPVVLFPARVFNKRLFSMSLDIPLFGISVGSTSVGVIANIAASLTANAQIGPGQIRRPRILAAFDPMREAGAASFQASGEVYVPASAELAVALSGGIGVSLLIVKAIGGIQVTGAVGLLGAFSLPVQLSYAGGRLAISGAAALYAEPRVRFQVDSFVKIVADLLLTTIEVYRKDWRLAAFEWGGDFRIGLRFPVRYVFGEPFQLSLDQLEFIAPPIEARRMIRDLLPR